MSFTLRPLPFVLLAMVLVACQTDLPLAHQPATTTSDGAFHGGITRPAPANNSNAATSNGVLLSAWADNPMCATLNATDRLKDQQAEQRACAAPLGQKVTWNNPDTGASGTIVAMRDGYDASGAYCRDFQQTIALGGEEQQKQCKACQRPDGTWQIVP